MLIDQVVNFMIEQCRRTYNLQDATLKEKTVADNKVKFKFEKYELVLTVEFKNERIAFIIYNNFLSERQTENITIEEFAGKYKDYLENTNIDSEEDLEKITQNILKEIKSGKLF